MTAIDDESFEIGVTDARVRRYEYQPPRVVPLLDYPMSYKCLPDGPILNKAHGRPREVLIDFDRCSPGAAHGFAVPSQRIFVVDTIEVLMHPWPELIYPSLELEVTLYDEIALDRYPLLSIAKPMVQPPPELAELEERVRQLEEEIETLKNGGTETAKHYLLPNAGIHVQIRGDADELTLQMEMLKHCRCRVSGWEARQPF